jgi:hypothetical protein
VATPNHSDVHGSATYSQEIANDLHTGPFRDSAAHYRNHNFDLSTTVTNLLVSLSFHALLFHHEDHHHRNYHRLALAPLLQRHGSLAGPRIEWQRRKGRKRRFQRRKRRLGVAFGSPVDVFLAHDFEYSNFVAVQPTFGYAFEYSNFVAVQPTFGYAFECPIYCPDEWKGQGRKGQWWKWQGWKRRKQLRMKLLTRRHYRNKCESVAYINSNKVKLSNR